MSETRIYAACLASYNNGVLHGAWIDCGGLSGDDLREEITRRVLLTSRFPNVTVEHPETGEQVPSAEEWAIHDHEGFGGLVGEYTSLDTIAEVAEALEDDSDGYKLIALRYLVENNGYSLGSAIDKIDDVFVSDQSMRDWAYDRFDECHEGGVDALPEMIRHAIDWDEVARQSEIAGEICRFDGMLIEDRT